MSATINPDIVTDGLVLCLDAANTNSYDDCELLLHMDGANNSTTFTDSSKNNFTVTANGNAKISTAQSKFGGASAMFDGNGDWLTIPANSVFDIGSADYTVEFWFLVNQNPGNRFNSYRRVLIANYSGPTSGWGFQIVGNATTYTQITHGDGDDLLISGNKEILQNTWYHCAFCKRGSSLSLYIDGILVGTGTRSTYYSSASNVFYIGHLNAASTTPWDFPGYIDELRITKGVARYTSNFTPSSSAHRNSNTWHDLSDNNKNATLVNGVAYNSSNNGSLVFDGSNDYALLNSTVVISGNFTIEVWFRQTSYSPSSFANQRCLIGGSSVSGGSNNCQFAIGDAGWIGLALNNQGISLSPDTTGFISLNNWYHLVWTRNGSSITTYLNGVVASTGATSADVRVDRIGQVGPTGSTAKNFPGNIFSVKFYSKHFTQSEIQQNYLAIKGRYGL